MAAKNTELTLTRTIHAPRALVFSAWTDPKHLAVWWGPGGFTNPRCEIDVRPNGRIRIDMRAPDGTVYPMDGVFKEIHPPERLVFISAALDSEGNRMFEVLNTITFEEYEGKTKLTVQVNVSKIRPEAAHYLDGQTEGWTQSLVRLEALIDKLLQNPT